MIDLTDVKEIYIYKEICDLRIGINGLAILAQELVDISNMKHKLFIFFVTASIPTYGWGFFCIYKCC